MRAERKGDEYRCLARSGELSLMCREGTGIRCICQGDRRCMLVMFMWPGTTREY